MYPRFVKLASGVKRSAGEESIGNCYWLSAGCWLLARLHLSMAVSLRANAIRVNRSWALERKTQRVENLVLTKFTHLTPAALQIVSQRGGQGTWRVALGISSISGDVAPKCFGSFGKWQKAAISTQFLPAARAADPLKKRERKKISRKKEKNLQSAKKPKQNAGKECLSCKRYTYRYPVNMRNIVKQIAISET